MVSRGRDRQSRVILLADRIRRLGLASPATILLEAGRPLAFLAAQLVWLSQPVLTLILSDQEVSGAAELLEDPDSVSALRALLDREPGDGGDSG
jgi:hypothetical protein